MERKLKAKKCRADECEVRFTPRNSTQVACSYPCALTLVQQKKVKAYKAETREMRKERNQKDRGYQLKKAQEAFNAYIRARDPQSQGCISCGSTSGKWTAGHFKTDKALRFHEDNCHGQCWWNCNSNKSGNIAEYRPRLVKKIGIERVEYLEQDHPSPKYTLDDIAAIKTKYKAKLAAIDPTPVSL